MKDSLKPAVAYAVLGAVGLGLRLQAQQDHTPILNDLAFHEHTGWHAILPTDWKVFLDFADK